MTGREWRLWVACPFRQWGDISDRWRYVERIYFPRPRKPWDSAPDPSWPARYFGAWRIVE